MKAWFACQKYRWDFGVQIIGQIYSAISLSMVLALFWDRYKFLPIPTKYMVLIALASYVGFSWTLGFMLDIFGLISAYSTEAWKRSEYIIGIIKDEKKIK